MKRQQKDLKDMSNLEIFIDMMICYGIVAFGLAAGWLVSRPIEYVLKLVGIM